jgi:hypothetical protein
MTTTNDKQDTKQETAAEKSILEAVFSLGTAWAAFGLNIGKLALQESARTLEVTAGKLSTLAETLEAKKKNGTVIDVPGSSVKSTS